MKEPTTSAMWDKDVTIIFCNICIKEIDAGNRPTAYFNKEGWQNISNRFKELTGRDYDLLKFKNKWDQLKKEWEVWKELKRGTTGLGWDPIKRTIDVSDEWWAEKLKAVPSAKKFKVCGIEPDFEKKLDFMFKGVVATGHHAFNPSEHEFAGIPEEFSPHQGTGSDEGSCNNPRDVDSANQPKGSRLSRKRKERDEVVKSSIDKLIEFFSAQPPIDLPVTGIKDCLLLLDSLPEVVADSNFYLKCVILLQDPIRRDVFMNLRPELRVQYLHLLFNN